MSIEGSAYVARLVKTLRAAIHYLASSVMYFSIGGLVVGLALIPLAIPMPRELCSIATAVLAWLGVVLAFILTSRVVRVGRRKLPKREVLWGAAVSVVAVVGVSIAVSAALVIAGLSAATPTTWIIGVGVFLLVHGALVRRRSREATSPLIVGSAIIALYPVAAVAAIKWGVYRAQILGLGILLVAYVFGGFYDLRKAMERLLGEEGLGGGGEAQGD
ncbi:MAG: hypothetical protein GXO32_01225 [Crenarchaeota archaeon]|nr:hypothetical protein [Thermoproteota archaeon]